MKLNAAHSFLVEQYTLVLRKMRTADWRMMNLPLGALAGVAVGAVMVMPEAQAAPQDAVWDGGGTTDNWDDGANWDQNLQNATKPNLFFAGNVRLTPFNDFDPAVEVANITSVTFKAGAGAFVVGGFAFNLDTSITNGSSNLQTIGNNIALSQGSHTFTTNGGGGDLTLSGALSNLVAGKFTPGIANIVKEGAGTLTLSGVNAYTGSTTVKAGTLSVTGSIATSSLTTVNSGATLLGTGVVGATKINSGGFLGAGTAANTTGVLSTGSVTLAGTYQWDVQNGTSAGAAYDQVSATGSVNITGASFAGTYIGGDAFKPVLDQVYVIVNNDGADGVTGTFTGLADGANVAIGGKNFAIKYNYAGGDADGNDIVLISLDGVASKLYVNDGWGALGNGTLVDGDLETGAAEAGTIGSSAFASVAAALASQVDYTGPLYLNGGSYATVDLSGTGAVEVRLVADASGADADSDAPDATIGTLQGASDDTIVTRFHDAAGNGDLIVGAGDFAGVISGGGSLTKNTAGVLILSGDNTYGGTTTVSAGTLQIGDGGATGELGAGDVTVAVDATLDIVRDATLYIESASVTNAGTVQLTSGLVALGGTLTNTGDLVVGAGSGAPGSAHLITNDTLDSSTGAVTIGTDGHLELNADASFDAATLTNEGTLTVNDGSTSVTGAYTQDADGAIVVGDGDFNPATLAFDATLTNHGTLSLNGGDATVTVAGDLDTDGTVVLQNGTLDVTGTVDVAGGTFTLNNGTVAAGNQVLVENGAVLDMNDGSLETTNGLFNAVGGTVTLDGGTFTSHASVTNEGTLTIGEDLLLAATTVQIDTNLFTANGGTTTITGGSVTAAAISTGSATLAITGGTVDATSGLINGDTIGATQTTISGGTVTVGAAGIVNNNLGTISISGTADVSSAGLVDNGSGATLDISGGAFAANGGLANAGEVDISGGAATVTGLLDNSGALAVSGGTLDAGSLTNGFTADFTGGTTTVAGTLTNAATGVLTVDGGAVSADALTNAGTLDLLDGTVTVTGNTTDNSGVMNIGDGVGAADSALYTEAGDFTNQAAGTVTVTGLDGGLKVTGLLDNQGTVTLQGFDGSGNDGPIVTVGSLDNQSGATLDIQDGSMAVLDLDAANNAGDLIVGDHIGDAGSARLEVNGILTNTGSITVNGIDGILVVSEDIVGGGTVTNDGGTVQVGCDIDGDVVNIDATFIIDGGITGKLTNSAVAADADFTITSDCQLLINSAVGGDVVNDSAGAFTATLDLGNNNGGAPNGNGVDLGGTLSNGVTGPAVVNVVGGSNTVSGAITNGDFGTINVGDGTDPAGSAVLVVAGGLSGGGAINILSDGQVDIESAASVDGAQLLNEGLLNVTTGDLTLNGDYTQDADGTLNVSGGSLSTGNLTNDGSANFTGGTTTLSGDLTNSATGTVTVDGGAVGAVNVDNANDLTVTSGSLAASGDIGNTGALLVEGGTVDGVNLTNDGTADFTGGTTTLSGDLVNSATGTVAVDGGAVSAVGVNNAGSLTVTGSGSLTASADIGNTGTLLVEGGTVDAVNLTNDASADFTGGYVTLTGDLVNSATGIATVAGCVIEVVGVDNAGSLTVTDGSLEASADIGNTGTLLVQGGLVDAVNLTNDASADFTGGTTTLTGDFTNSATGTATIDGGDVSVAGVSNAGSLTVTSGSLAASADIDNTGTLLVEGGAVDAVNLTNDASADFTGGTTTLTGDFVNSATGTATVDGGDVSVAGVSNDGSLTVTSGSLAASADIDTTGTLLVEGGTVDGVNLTNDASADFTGGTTTLTGDFTNSATGTATVDGGDVSVAGVSNDGSLTVTSGSLAASADIDNTGTLLVEGGTVDAVNLTNDGDATFTGGTTTLTGTLTNGATGTVTVDGGPLTIDALDNSGQVSLVDGTITVTGNSTDNAGVLDIGDGVGIAGSALYDEAGDFTNQAAGEVTVTGLDGALQVGGLLDNQGTTTLVGFDASGNDGPSALADALDNSGTLDILDGTLTVTNDADNSGALQIGDTIGDALTARLLVGGNFTNSAAGSIEVFGIDGGLDVTGNLANDGALTLHAGTQVNVGGDLTLGATSALTLDIDSTIVVAGTATLGGSLTITGLDTLVDPLTEDRLLIQADTVTGAFTNLADDQSIGTFGDVEYFLRLAPDSVGVGPMIVTGINPNSSIVPLVQDQLLAAVQGGYDGGAGNMASLAGRSAGQPGQSAFTGEGDRATALASADPTVLLAADGTRCHARLIGSGETYSRSESTHQADAYRIGLGFDVDLDDDKIVGISLSYGNRETERATTSATMEDIALSGYARFVLDRADANTLFLDCGAGVGFLSAESERQTETGLQTSDTKGWNANAVAKLGYEMALSNQTVLTPYAGLRTGFAHLDDYVEGGTVPVQVQDQDGFGSQLFLGADWGKVHALKNGGRFSWHVGAEVFTAFFEGDIRLSLAGPSSGTPLFVEPDADNWGLLTKAGVAYEAHQWQFGLEVGSILTENGQGWQGTLSVVKSW